MRRPTSDSGSPTTARQTSSSPVRRERPAVGCVGVDQRAHLVDEPVDDDVDAEIARQRLARP